MTAVHTDDTFVDELRRALHHLHDPTELQRSTLIDVFGLRRAEQPPVALRHLLTDAIERLRPEERTPRQARSWRAYQILFYRFVEQSTQREVGSDLGLSIRHLRRAETLAVEALADYLWNHYNLAATWGRATRAGLGEQDGQSADAQTPSREQELRWLHSSMPSAPAVLAEVVGAAVHLVAPLAQAGTVRIERDIAEGLPRLAMPVTTLRHALVSLLSVALQRAPHGTVRISSDLHEWTVRLTIEARGAHPTSGADPQESERLQMASQLLGLYGGALEIPRQAAGTAFVARVTLPAAEHVPVLVIDDNADTLRLMQRYLANSRYRFVGTGDPQQALRLAEVECPRVIVLDVMLPDVDGWELLGRLREHPLTRHVPVVVCSILPEEQLAASLGAAAFLRKPISRQDFLAALDQQVGLPATGCC